MNQTLFDYIRHLSKQDKKSLAEKALKTAEEVGELAKVTLPYVSAYATNHRFIEKERILEEAVDTVLCALSVAYDLDFTDDEIESMIKIKSTKWADLQKGEVELKFPIPFEIHVTVKPQMYLTPEENVDNSIEQFRQVCKSVEVKPIILDLQDQQGHITKDVMTSSTHFGDNTSVYKEAQRIANAFRKQYDVVRVKIETVPWHPASPKKLGDKMPESCYFEAHIPIIHSVDITPMLQCAVTAWNSNSVIPVHISRNAFKRHADGSITTMITYRTETHHQKNFEQNVDDIVANFSKADIAWNVGKVHKEFSIYDTNKSHDANWLLGEK